MTSIPRVSYNQLHKSSKSVCPRRQIGSVLRSEAIDMRATQNSQNRHGATRLDWLFGLGIAFVVLLIALRGIATMRTKSLERTTATRQKEVGAGIIGNKWLKGEFRWGEQTRRGSSRASDVPSLDTNRASNFAADRKRSSQGIDPGDQAKAALKTIGPAVARPSAEAVNKRD